VAAPARASGQSEGVWIYKILLPSEWTEFDGRGEFDGSPFDHASGFIHCSSRAQVGATALRVFPLEPALVVVALDTGPLGKALRWEPAPGGGTFPHVYVPIRREAVGAVYHIAGAALVDALLPAE
jgi:uncharacterized protein (DUF952 family)